MPRAAREKSKSGIYHIILRGINRQNIFEDEEDYLKFLQTLSDYKQKSMFEIYAYCLMSNHIHLLLKEGKEDLGMVFRRIGASFVYWYNWKYKRCGHLFQDRFKSEAVEDESYLLIVLRYIHQNPVKAGIESYTEKYKWSSFHEYTTKEQLCSTDFILKLFSQDKTDAVNQFKEFTDQKNDDRCLDIEDQNLRLTDQEAKEMMFQVCQTTNVTEFQKFDTSVRDEYLKELGSNGISTRQLARLTGVGRSIIMRVIR